MSWVAIGVAVGGAVVGAVERNRADTKSNRAADRIKGETEVRKKKLAETVSGEVQAERDVANVLEGQTSISPEAAYARRMSEQASASAIDKALKTGVSSGEIMSRVAALTGQGQQNTRAISAQEESRRRQAQVGAKQQRAQAARVKTRGQQQEFQLEDIGTEKTLQQQQLINQASGQTQQSIGNLASDIGGAYTMSKMGFGGGGFGGGGGMGGGSFTMPNISQYNYYNPNSSWRNR